MKNQNFTQRVITPKSEGRMPVARFANTSFEDKQRADMAIDPAVPTIYGCSPLFNLDAEDALLSLSMEPNPFVDWLGWSGTNICHIHKYFLNFVRAKKSGASYTSGVVTDPCADPETYEFDVCDFTIDDFARLRRGSPVRDVTKLDLNYTWNQPRYRLDGTAITDDREFDIKMTGEVLIQDLCKMIVSGNSSNASEFDGLEQLVTYGYTNSSGAACKMMDSIVIDWNDNGFDGGSGITWNGVAVASSFGFFDVLHDVYRKIRRRIRMAPALAASQIKEGDLILVLPEDFASPLLDAYTCWLKCGGDVTRMDSFEARDFRDKLNGGMFGVGQITIDSFKIPLMPFDYGLINEVDNFDMFLLTGQVGSTKVLHGEVNDMTSAPKVAPDRYSIDGGRFLTWEDYEHTCVKSLLEMQPRLISWAPWSNARFSNVLATLPGGIISSDPTSTYFPY